MWELARNKKIWNLIGGGNRGGKVKSFYSMLFRLHAWGNGSVRNKDKKDKKL